MAMATRKSSCKSKANQHPVDNDFLWEELPNEQAWPEFSLPSQLGNVPSVTKQENSPVCGGSVGQQAVVEKEPADYQHLKLLQETHKLEIAKLKLQLELAMAAQQDGADQGTRRLSQVSGRSSSSSKDAASTTLAASTLQVSQNCLTSYL